jgi:hypothetical protein
MNIDSIVLFIALGIKVALLGFIFQDKLIQLLSHKNSTNYKSVTMSNSSSTITETEELSQEETEEAEEETSPEVTICDTQTITKAHAKTTKKRKTASFVKLARHVFALSLINENAKATAPSSIPEVKRILADVENTQSKVFYSGFEDSKFENLSQKLEFSQFGKSQINLEDPQLAASIESNLIKHPFQTDYQSKRGTKLAAKYLKFVSDSSKSRNVKKRIGMKLAKVGRKIARKRPFASKLISIKEEIM